jgi:3',5'-cyclic AMP phosphodiesterase CpdA
MKRVLHISDPHLRRSDRASLHSWKQVEAIVREERPDVIINTGDLVRDAPDNAEDHGFASRCQLRLGIDVLSVPGNHDIGDGPPSGSGPDLELAVAFAARHGKPRWVRQVDDWTLIGINAMLFGSGQDTEAAEWDWLETVLADQNGRRPVALFVHKPPFLISPEEPDNGSATMPASIRGRFWSLAKDHGVRLVGCGHRHEYRAVLVDGILTVWAPTTSLLLDEATPPLRPYAYPGLVEYAFCGRSVMHRPIRIRTIGDDL